MDKSQAPSAQDSVTVVIRRTVKTGHEAAYEDWLQRFQAAAQGLDGYLGATVQKPSAPSGNVYTTVLRFASLAQLQAFEASPLRQQFLDEVTPHVTADATWERLTGLEFWFSPPAGTKAPQPIRWRMCLLMIAVVYGLVLTIGGFVGFVLTQLFGQVPFAVRLFITIVIEVILMTYVIMPTLTRHLAKWIFKN